MAKRVLAEQLTALGYQARLEETRRHAGRWVDVAATLVGARGVHRRVAIEFQDSPIRVETMKARVALDRRLGYDATAWVFTHQRARGRRSCGW
jgi:competence CoiA-like predicted nuclease